MTAPTPRNLVRAQVTLESFRLAPDGGFVVYALRRVVGGGYQSHLWVRSWEGGRARPLTRGAVSDGSPAISPDGRMLAFVRSPVGDGAGVAQAWILPLDGGEPWQLTAQAHGVSSVMWSPDGRRLALLGQAGDQRFIVGKEREGRTPLARRITRLDFRDDDSGHVVRRSHLWVMPVRAAARPRQLTSGDYDVIHPAWSPDGSRIAFAADRSPDSTIQPRYEILAVGTGTRPRLSEVASLAGDATRPAYSPDGRSLAFVGTDVHDAPEDVPPAVWLKPPAGPAQPLTSSLDRPVGEWAWSDLLLAEEAPGPTWIDESSLAVIVGDRGRGLPYRVGVTGSPEPLVEGRLRIGSAGIEARAGRVAISAAVDGRAGEVYAVEGGRLREITREGSVWQRRFPRPEIDELELKGPAGPIQAWLASPGGAGRGRLPTVLHLHGGPTGAWSPGGTLDAIALTAAGYRVLMPNIRGSATFGREWAGAVSARWGEVDAEDALAAVDGVIQRGLADPARLAVMGLSYGGYLAQWLIGVTDRFAAAAAENGVSNHVSAWGNSYFGVHYNRRGGLGDPLSDEGMTRLWRASPLRNAPKMHTPLLMLQAEEDRICPASDAEQLFTALKVLGRDVELILYPEEHHGMKSSGRPDRRIDRMERILAWFERHLHAESSRPRRRTSG